MAGKWTLAGLQGVENFHQTVPPPAVARIAQATSALTPAQGADGIVRFSTTTDVSRLQASRQRMRHRHRVSEHVEAGQRALARSVLTGSAEEGAFNAEMKSPHFQLYEPWAAHIATGVRAQHGREQPTNQSWRAGKPTTALWTTKSRFTDDLHVVETKGSGKYDESADAVARVMELAATASIAASKPKRPNRRGSVPTAAEAELLMNENRCDRESLVAESEHRGDSTSGWADAGIEHKLSHTSPSSHFRGRHHATPVSPQLPGASSLSPPPAHGHRSHSASVSRSPSPLHAAGRRLPRWGVPVGGSELHRAEMRMRFGRELARARRDGLLQADAATGASMGVRWAERNDTVGRHTLQTVKDADRCRSSASELVYERRGRAISPSSPIRTTQAGQASSAPRQSDKSQALRRSGGKNLAGAEGPSRSPMWRTNSFRARAQAGPWGSSPHASPEREGGAVGGGPGSSRGGGRARTARNGDGAGSGREETVSRARERRASLGSSLPLTHSNASAILRQTARQEAADLMGGENRSWRLQVGNDSQLDIPNLDSPLLGHGSAAASRGAWPFQGAGGTPRSSTRSGAVDVMAMVRPHKPSPRALPSASFWGAPPPARHGGDEATLGFAAAGRGAESGSAQASSMDAQRPLTVSGGAAGDGGRAGVAAASAAAGRAGDDFLGRSRGQIRRGGLAGASGYGRDWFSEVREAENSGGVRAARPALAQGGEQVATLDAQAGQREPALGQLSLLRRGRRSSVVDAALLGLGAADGPAMGAGPLAAHPAQLQHRTLGLQSESLRFNAGFGASIRDGVVQSQVEAAGSLVAIVSQSSPLAHGAKLTRQESMRLAAAQGAVYDSATERRQLQFSALHRTTPAAQVVGSGTIKSPDPGPEGTATSLGTAVLSPPAPMLRSIGRGDQPGTEDSARSRATILSPVRPAGQGGSLRYARGRGIYDAGVSRSSHNLLREPPENDAASSDADGDDCPPDASEADGTPAELRGVRVGAPEMHGAGILGRGGQRKGWRTAGAAADMSPGSDLLTGPSLLGASRMQLRARPDASGARRFETGSMPEGADRPVTRPKQPEAALKGAVYGGRRGKAPVRKPRAGAKEKPAPAGGVLSPAVRLDPSVSAEAGEQGKGQHGTAGAAIPQMPRAYSRGGRGRRASADELLAVHTARAAKRLSIAGGTGAEGVAAIADQDRILEAAAVAAQTPFTGSTSPPLRRPRPASARRGSMVSPGSALRSAAGRGRRRSVLGTGETDFVTIDEDLLRTGASQRGSGVRHDVRGRGSSPSSPPATATGDADASSTLVPGGLRAEDGRPGDDRPLTHRPGVFGCVAGRHGSVGGGGGGGEVRFRYTAAPASPRVVESLAGRRGSVSRPPATRRQSVGAGEDRAASLDAGSAPSRQLEVPTSPVGTRSPLVKHVDVSNGSMPPLEACSPAAYADDDTPVHRASASPTSTAVSPTGHETEVPVPYSPPQHAAAAEQTLGADVMTASDQLRPDSSAAEAVAKPAHVSWPPRQYADDSALDLVSEQPQEGRAGPPSVADARGGTGASELSSTTGLGSGASGAPSSDTPQNDHGEDAATVTAAATDGERDPLQGLQPSAGDMELGTSSEAPQPNTTLALTSAGETEVAADSSQEDLVAEAAAAEAEALESSSARALQRALRQRERELDEEARRLAIEASVTTSAARLAAGVPALGTQSVVGWAVQTASKL